MKNSKKFIFKIKLNRFLSIVLFFLIIYLLIKNVFLDLINNIPQNAAFIIIAIIILCILFFEIRYILSLNKLLKTDIDNVLYELDNKLDKYFDSFGLYLTKNYLVCIGGKFPLFNTFVIPIKEIEAIDTHRDSRFFYQRKGEKSKPIIKSLICDSLFNDDRSFVFNIITNKKIYCVTTILYLKKYRKKKIIEAADYICNKYENIDYI